MNSSCSTPSPPASSSLKAPTLADAPEVKEEEDFEQSTSTAAAIDMTALLQNNPAIQALLGSGMLSDNANLAISKLFGASGITPISGVKREASPTEGDTPKKTRLKVFSNGFFMTFDKVSSCQKKHFWRCEYKNTCKARMHTDINSEKILTFIHEHNHSPPTSEEIRLYGLDPASIEMNRVYVVGNMADPNQRRKIRKQVADQEAALKRVEEQQILERQQKEAASTIAAARAAIAQAAASSSSGPLPSSSSSSTAAVAASLFQAPSSATASVNNTMTSHAMLLAQLPFIKKELPQAEVPAQPYISPNQPMQSATASYSMSMLPRTVQIPPLIIPSETAYDPSIARQGPSKRTYREMLSEDDPMKNDPMFEPTFEIARKLRKLWKGEPNRYPRTTTTPTRHLEFFISKSDGTDEHLYVPMRIEARDEVNLKAALQEFCGQKCIGMLLFGVSPKISVMFNQPMMCSWDNNQFFLLDISNPSRWRLMYVDDKAV